MDVKVESTITLTINGQKFILTRGEALILFNSLAPVVGGSGPNYPFGVRSNDVWPYTMPNSIPCSPQTPKYGSSFEITCSTSEAGQ